MAYFLKRSHSLPAHPHVYPQSEWAIPAFTFPAIAGTHLPTPDGWKAELAWVAWYVVRQFSCPKAVTHPTTNRAQYVAQLRWSTPKRYRYTKPSTVRSKLWKWLQTQFCSPANFSNLLLYVVACGRVYEGPKTTERAAVPRPSHCVNMVNRKNMSHTEMSYYAEIGLSKRYGRRPYVGGPEYHVAYNLPETRQIILVRNVLGSISAWLALVAKQSRALWILAQIDRRNYAKLTVTNRHNKKLRVEYVW